MRHHLQLSLRVNFYEVSKGFTLGRFLISLHNRPVSKDPKNSYKPDKPPSSPLAPGTISYTPDIPPSEFWDSP